MGDRSAQGLVRRLGRCRPAAASLLLFATLAAAGIWVVRLDAGQRRADRGRLIASYATEVRAELEDELFRSINLARGLRAFAVAYPDLGDRDRLETLLADAYAQGVHVRNVGLAPGNVVTVVYPLAGNESAVGLRYEDLPEQFPAIEHAMRIRSTVLAGPVNLVQGGRGLINRTPVFLADGSYWGMVSLVLDLQSLITHVGQDTRTLPVAWGVRVSSTTLADTFLGGDRSVFDDNEVPAASVTFDVPDGTWEVAVAPTDPYSSRTRSRTLGGLVVLIAAAISGLAYQALRENRKISQLSLHDPLTGLPNRRLLADRFEQAAAAASRAGSPLALLYIDLDSFKPLNDAHGHQAGDHVLTVVADRLRTRLRGADTIARVGGDEFVALLSGTPSESLPLLIADLEDRIAQPVAWHDQTLRVGSSLGAAVYPDDGSDLDSLLTVADSSMYAVKANRPRRPPREPQATQGATVDHGRERR